MMPFVSTQNCYMKFKATLICAMLAASFGAQSQTCDMAAAEQRWKIINEQIGSEQLAEIKAKVLSAHSKRERTTLDQAEERRPEPVYERRDESLAKGAIQLAAISGALTFINSWVGDSVIGYYEAQENLDRRIHQIDDAIDLRQRLELRGVPDHEIKAKVLAKLKWSQDKSAAHRDYRLHDHRDKIHEKRQSWKAQNIDVESIRNRFYRIGQMGGFATFGFLAAAAIFGDSAYKSSPRHYVKDPRTEQNMERLYQGSLAELKVGDLKLLRCDLSYLKIIFSDDDTLVGE